MLYTACNSKILTLRELTGNHSLPGFLKNYCKNWFKNLTSLAKSCQTGGYIQMSQEGPWNHKKV